MERKKKIVFNFGLYAQALFWVVLFVMLLFSFVNAGSRLEMAAQAAFLLLFCHALNFYLLYSWMTPVWFEKGRYGAFTAGIFLLLLLLTPFRLWVESHFIHRPYLLVRGRRLSGLVIFSEVSIGTFAFLFRMAVDSQRHLVRASAIEKLQLQTELKFLKFQMHPHFLFNTINNVYSLSLSGSAKTPEALLKLSGLLRYLLYECNHPVALSRELNALEAYIDLFQLRYEEPLNIRLTQELRSMDKLIEPMLLIPLLENAIKHSGIGVEEAAFIEIALREREGELYMEMANSRPGIITSGNGTPGSITPPGGITASGSITIPGATTPPNSIIPHGAIIPPGGITAPGGITTPNSITSPGGIGLVNIRKRLEMMGPDYSTRDLEIRESATRFDVTLKIPLA